MTWAVEDRVKRLYRLVSQHRHEKMHKYSCESCYNVQLLGHVKGFNFCFEVQYMDTVPNTKVKPLLRAQ
jgi:hypothetical protein